MPRSKTSEILSNGPKRRFCSHAYKEKAVFPNYKAALNFLQNYCDDFTRHMGTYARAVYYCPECKGWHLTKHVPAFDDSHSNFEGVVIDGNVYVPRELGEGVNACYACHIEVVKRCREGKTMPCLAYKGNVCMKRDIRFLLMKRREIEE